MLFQIYVTCSSEEESKVYLSVLFCRLKAHCDHVLSDSEHDKTHH